MRGSKITTMKVAKILGWFVVGLGFLVGLAYGLFPAIGRVLITQALINQGLTDIEITIDRPSLYSLKIPLISFHVTAESESTSVVISNTEITYSGLSLLDKTVEVVNIEHLSVEWDFLSPEISPDSSTSPPAMDEKYQFPLSSFRSETILPVLPFHRLNLQHVQIFNPLAPPTLQRISLNANMIAQPEEYEGSIHFEEEALLLNLFNFSLNQDGSLSLIGIHTSRPKDHALAVKTSLERSNSSLKILGKTSFKLHPLIHTLAAMYPVRPEFQKMTGTFSGTWTGTLSEQQTHGDTPLGPISGDFSLDAQLPSWPPVAQDIRLLTKGTFAMDSDAITVAFQPSSSGSVNLFLESLISSTPSYFLAHQGPRSFSWNVQESLHVSLPITPNLETANLRAGKVLVTMHNAAEQIDAYLSPKDLRWQKSRGFEGSGVLKISTEINPATNPSLNLETLSLNAEASLKVTADQITAHVNPQSRLHLINLKNESLQVPECEVRFPQGIYWTYDTRLQSWKFQAATSTINLSSLFVQGQQWSLGQIDTTNLAVTSAFEKWAIKGETIVNQLRPPIASYTIPPSSWQTRYSINPTSFGIHFTGNTLEPHLQIGGQIRLNLASGSGSASLTLSPIQFSPPHLVLSRLIQPWPNPDMDVTHGTISGSMETEFRKNSDPNDQSFHMSHLHGIVELRDIDGFFKPTIIQGLTTRLEILGKNEALRIPSTPLRIRTIQSAVGLTETSLLLSTETFLGNAIPRLSLRNMSTHLLGGTVSLADTEINPSAETHDVTLHVTGLDLNEVLRLEQQETLKGTGTLDGTLPLTIAGKAITVKKGTMQGRPPGGTLQFEVPEETARSWAKSQPQLDLIIQSLKNYQYSKLAIGVDYQKNGILKLATRLEGKNPDFRNGVPIHFNLNIEENLPALLKSLSLVKELEKKIETMMTGKGRNSNKKKTTHEDFQKK